MTDSLTIKQRLFVSLLLLLGFILSYFIVRWIDPSIAFTQNTSIEGMLCSSERAVVLALAIAAALLKSDTS
jgi:hypothetical protein